MGIVNSEAAVVTLKARQLLCVVFADMAGYSALTSMDEVGTHDMWMRFVDEVVRPQTQRKSGDVIRTLGDGILLTFQSTSAALEWAIAVQDQILQGRVGKTARYPGLSLRIGLHVCEVIHDGNDVYGDGVNITKRLQEAVEPDGIIISEELYQATRKSVPVEVRNLGFLTLKNIGDPVRAYEVIRPKGFDVVGRALAQKKLPSIAVLPLQNLSGEEEFKYFADGVVEDIIVSLSAMKELLVISRASALAFNSGESDPREVGKILDVRYVLMGTLRRSTTKLRLSVSLCDTSNGEIIFSEKSEFYHKDLFDTQDRIVEHVVSRIAPNVRASESRKALRKPPDNFTAYDLTLKALDLMTHLDKESFDQALKHLKAAMELDPNFAMPVAYAARWHCIYIGQGWDDDRQKYIAAAREYASRAVNLDRQNALGLAAYGHVKSYLEHDYDSALVFLDRAREMGPSQSIAWILSSGTLSYIGRYEEAIEHARHGVRLSPNDPDIFQYYDFLCLAYYLNREFDEAVKWGERSFAENPSYTANWRLMVVSNAGAGKMERAEYFAKKIISRDKDFKTDSFVEEFCPFREPTDRKMYSEHLRSAGLA
jgi:TolB-like protein/class 3 adenylate cyclase/tetratricopeptide (TPR) repeat protein